MRSDEKHIVSNMNNIGSCVLVLKKIDMRNDSKTTQYRFNYVAEWNIKKYACGRDEKQLLPVRQTLLSVKMDSISQLITQFLAFDI